MIPGSIAKTFPVNVFVYPSVVKDTSDPFLICPIYFSGTEKLIFKGFMLDRLAITAAGVKYTPSDIDRSPIFPLKGAKIEVFASCARINWACAFRD
ncbi:hypothetical protein D3C71_1845530 [compost metagenome]